MEVKEDVRSSFGSRGDGGNLTKNEVTWPLLFDTFLIIKKWGPHARMAFFFDGAIEFQKRHMAEWV